MSFDTTTLVSILNALAEKTGSFPKRISTLSDSIAKNPALKGLVKEVQTTADAFGIDLKAVGYTFTASQNKDSGAIKVYQPTIGKLAEVTTLVWGKLALPLSTFTEKDLTVQKETFGFSISATSVKGKKAVQGKIKLRLPKKAQLSLGQLQELLGDDETPEQLFKVLDNCIIDVVPAIALGKYAGQTLSISSWTVTRDGDFGKQGFMTLHELGAVKIQAPSSVRNEVPRVNYDVPDHATFEPGEFLLRIGEKGVAKTNAGHDYLVCTAIQTAGVDLSGFAADEQVDYDLPDFEPTRHTTDNVDLSSFEGDGYDALAEATSDSLHVTV